MTLDSREIPHPSNGGNQRLGRGDLAGMSIRLSLSPKSSHDVIARRQRPPDRDDGRSAPLSLVDPYPPAVQREALLKLVAGLRRAPGVQAICPAY
jgi:hypothetical protein